MIKVKNIIKTIALVLAVLSVFCSCSSISKTFANCNVVYDASKTENGNIQFDESKFDLTDLDQAVSYAIFLANNTQERKWGECYAEGHEILDKKEASDKVYLCVQVNEGFFGFENGIFTCVSGSSIPTKITLIKEKGKYKPLKYEIPLDGSDYSKSLKTIFTKKAINKIDKVDNKNITKQLEKYASDYLNSIDRQAKIQWSYVEKEFPEIENAELSNKLSKEFWQYPSWIGSNERIENGERIVYSHFWESNGKGGGTAIFKKQIYNGVVLEEFKVNVNENTYEIIK